MKLADLRHRLADLPKKPKAIAIAWFRREDYAAIVAMSPDGTLPATYGEFEEIAGARYAAVLADGHRLEKIMIQPVAFAEWCRVNRLAPDRNARALFAAMLLATKGVADA